MQMKTTKLTKASEEALIKLWFIFGNHGKKSTLFNHKYIQGFLEAQEDRKEFYVGGRENLIGRGFGHDALTEECIEAVEEIVYGPAHHRIVTIEKSTSYFQLCSPWTITELSEAGFIVIESYRQKKDADQRLAELNKSNT